MSNAPIIQLDSVSKAYTIGHRSSGNGGYVAFRDVMEQWARGLARRFRDLLAGRHHVHGDHTESFWALRDISITVAEGEVVGIIGRNGAGKSTLLKILSRITEPTLGRLTLRGRVSSLLEVGTGFHPELTGRENIFLNGSILGMTRAEIRSRFDAIVDFAGVERFLDTPVKRYSSGMYVRLAFAVAAHLEPEILVVDEVLAVGDTRFQQRCLDKMHEVTRKGRTVLFVSHNMQAVSRLCRNAVLLDGGRVVRQGPAEEVVRAYLDTETVSCASREWPSDAPTHGHPQARLRRVTIIDPGTGHPTGTIDIRHPFRIVIEYENHPGPLHIYANVQLHDHDNICLFASGDFSNPNWRHAPRRFHGIVRSSCTIPGNFLAEGRFRVLVALTTHHPNEILALVPDAVSFTVVDVSQGDGVRGEYVGRYPGVLRPLLEWQVDCRHARPTGLAATIPTPQPA